MNLEEILKQVKEFVVENGKLALDSWQKGNIESIAKAGADITTNVDKQIEQDFSDYVLKSFPQHGFIGEELPELTRRGEYTWMIDPIDGTKYYAEGLPMWSTTVALVKGNQPIIGIVYVPTSDQLYEASLGGGARMNGQKLCIKQETSPNLVQVAWDYPDWRESKGSSYRKICDSVFLDLVDNFSRVRLLGNGTFSVTWVAKGFFSAHVDPCRKSEKFVDVAGGLLIAQEAGAKVIISNLEGGSQRIVVGQPVIAAKIEGYFQQYLK